MITPYYPPIKGGVTTYVLNLVESLKNKYDITVYVITREGKSDINILSFNYPKWLFALSVFIVLNKKKPDVIHSHSWWYTLLPSIFYKFIHPKTKVIHTLHTQPVGETLKSIKSRFFSLFLSRCDVVTFVSKSQMKEMGKHFKITSPKKVIYGAVSPEKVSGNKLMEIKNNFSLNGKQPIISFVGLVVYEKKAEGVKKLIESIKILKMTYPQIRLLIIGDGEFRKNLEERASDLGLNENVIFTGFKENVYEFLAITDIYAHLSLQESLGLSILEAMSKGMPVIAANTGGIPEIIDNGINGILVEPDPKIIAEAISELYENKNRMKQLGNNARITIEKRFSLDKLAEEFVSIYMNSVDNSGN